MLRLVNCRQDMKGTVSIKENFGNIEIIHKYYINVTSYG